MDPVDPSHIDRRSMVRWLALGSVWMVAPGCRGTAGSPKGGGADGCCPDDGTTGDGTTGDGTTGDGTTGGTTDSAGDTGDPVPCATADDIEGPYYTPGAPETDDLTEGGVAGTPLRIVGRILDETDCVTPLAGAILDVWQADDDGVYDNAGYRLRGRVECDADGRFDLRTIVPGRYDVRPVKHIHFKVWVGERERITSQFYFSDDERYSAETFAGPALTVDASGTAEVVLAV